MRAFKQICNKTKICLDISKHTYICKEGVVVRYISFSNVKG